MIRTKEVWELIWSLSLLASFSLGSKSDASPSMEQHMDCRHLSIDSCSLIRGDSGRTELNKKRKLPCEHTDLGSGSPISKQKRESQQGMELAESTENSMNSHFINHDHDTADPYMEPDWYCTYSSSYSNEATSSSTVGSSTEFNSGVSTDISVSEGIDYSFRKGLLEELVALHDPVINELVKSNMVVCEDPDGDTLDSMQGGGAGPRPLTIDQEFEQYFSKLML